MPRVYTSDPIYHLRVISTNNINDSQLMTLPVR